jgi:hypothetical protein
MLRGINSSAYFFNYGTGNVISTITGGLTLNGDSMAYFTNGGNGTINNTIDIITINDTCELNLGGGGSTTIIDTLNWYGGILSISYSNNSFGDIIINTLNLGAGPLMLHLNESHQDLSTKSPLVGRIIHTILNVGTVTGDPSEIKPTNNLSFTEFVDTDRTGGITIDSSGKVNVTLVSTDRPVCRY